MPRLRILLCLSGALLLAGCSLGGVTYDPNRGLEAAQSANQSNPTESDSGGGILLGDLFGSGTSNPRAGYVVGDEPSAVKAASAVLQQGGSAADAATTLYLAMSVTFPGAAGLGGGGACVVYNERDGRAHTIAFMAGKAGGGTFGLPGTVRGLQALQSRYGRLPWARDVAYAEALAATGFPVSAALEQRLKTAVGRIRQDRGLAREFLDAAGQVKSVGSIVRAPALASTLDTLRRDGPGAFYRGVLAREIVRAIAAHGGSLSLNDLENYQASIESSPSLRIDSHRLYVAAMGARGDVGPATALIRPLFTARGSARTATPAALARDVLARARARYPFAAHTADQGATGFAALDASGQAVACAVTMNGPFGSATTVPGTGIVLAAARKNPKANPSPPMLSPMILVRNDSGPILLPDSGPVFVPVLVGAGAGGPGSAAAMAYAILRLVRDSALTVSGQIPSGLVTANDSVNAIACHDGVCSVLTNPQAAGFAEAIAARRSGS